MVAVPFWAQVLKSKSFFVIPSISFFMVSFDRDCNMANRAYMENSKQNFELVFLAKTPSNAWALDHDNRVVLPGAHGSEIVRSFCFFDDEQVVFTTGEDGNVKAWRAG
jgi:hypothetical protein